MEEGQGAIHQLNLRDRKTGMMTGIVDVISFDSQQILLETTQGMLMIKGKELHVSRLCLEKGEVDIEGMMDSLVYTDGGTYARKQKGSLMKRLFE